MKKPVRYTLSRMLFFHEELPQLSKTQPRTSYAEVLAEMGRGWPISSAWTTTSTST